MKTKFCSLLVLLFSFSLLANLNSPLPIDPRLEKFTLSNGLKVLIQQNNKPKDNVELWLHVDTGALDEEDNERGLAHYLEHMAFNGSKNFPAGTLVKAFESMGLTFGLHQNAFTGFDQTTYTITMPNNDEENIDKALLCLSDFAFRLTLTKKEVDRERKVIIEEKRSRSGASQRIIEKTLPQIFPGSRLAYRLPIGILEVIEKVDRDDFIRFYRKWYHPKNATLMIVGDVQKEEIKKIVQKHFSEWETPKNVPKHLESGVKNIKGRHSFVMSDPEISEVSISLDITTNPEIWKTEKDFQRKMKDNLIHSMINRRLNNLISEGKAAFQSAYIARYDFVGTCTYSSMNANSSVKNWRQAYADFIRELRRIKLYGFTDRDLELAKKSMLSGAELAVQNEKSQLSNAIASSLNSAISDGQLPISAEQSLSLINKYIKAITKQELHKIYQKNFSFNDVFVTAQFPEKCQDKATKEDLLRMLENFESEKIAETKEEKFATKLLKKELPLGKLIESSTHHEKLDVTTVKLTNGVIYHQRSMDYQKDMVNVKVIISGGSIEETAASKEYTSFAVLPFSHHSTKSLSHANIKYLKTGKKYSLSGSYEDDMLTLSLTASKEDLEEGMKLLYLILSEAKIEKPVFDLYKQQLKQQLEVIKSDTKIQLNIVKKSLLSGEDPRMAIVSEKELDRIQLSDVQNFLDQVLKNSIEASIVGDIPREEALKLMNKYLGNLSKRKTKNLDLLRRLNIPNKALFKKIEVKTVTNKAFVMLGYRLNGDYSVRERRMVILLSQILSTRLHEEIREKRGLTYGASARREFSDAYNNYHSFYGSFVAEPAKAEEGLKAANEVLKDFFINGPTEEELKTVKKKIDTLVKSTQEKPTYWVSRLADLRYHKTKLNDLLTVRQSYQSITKEELMIVIKRFHKPENKFEILSLPKKEK